MLHVVPSSMFGPIGSDSHAEFSVEACIIREYMEELFGTEYEQVAHRDAYRPNQLRLEKQVQFLESLREQGKAKLLLTGIGWNLLNLRPDICCLLVIDSPEWWRRHNPATGNMPIKQTFEYMTQAEAQAAGLRKDTSPAIPFGGASDADLLQMGLGPEELCPPGACAFWLGTRALRKLSC